MLRTLCPSCHAIYKISKENLAKVVSCNKCGFDFIVEMLRSENTIPLIIQVGINMKKISPERVADIMKFHYENTDETTIEDFLLSEGILSEEDLSLLLVETLKLYDKFFIKTALDDGVLEKDVIKEALTLQKKELIGGELIMIGSILVSLGHLNGEQFHDMLEKQHGERKRLFEQAQKVDSEKDIQREAPKVLDPMTVRQEINLCKYGVSHKYLTKDQLEEAFSEYKKLAAGGEKKFLRQILIDKKYITFDKLNHLYSIREFGKIRELDNTFGEIAIESGVVEKDDIQGALNEQLQEYKENKETKRILDILSQKGVLTEEKVKTILLKKDELDREKALRQETNEAEPGPEKESVEAKPSEISKKTETDAGITEEKLNKAEQAKGVDTEAEGAPESETDRSEIQIIPEEEAAKISEPKLEISYDNLRAYLIVPGVASGDIHGMLTVDTVKILLLERGIVFGVSDDDVIANLLNTDVSKTRKILVAKGFSEIFGKDSRISYNFQTDYLTPGVIMEDGSINFKERGETPHVTQGEILAVKTPLVEGTDGMDVYGNELLCRKVTDHKLTVGNGAGFSEDKLSVIAKIDGRPDLSVTGKVSVFNEIVIPGNVDYESGNVDFEGNILVRESVLEGFSVKGVNVTAKEIAGGSVRVTNDLNISSGIFDAEVFADGNIQAMFITNSRIYCFGDVIVTKEIIDSEVLTSGRCIIERGKIINSKITAKKGIVAAQTGTEKSNPCRLKVGTNDHTESVVNLYKLEIDTHFETIELLGKKIKVLKDYEKTTIEDISNKKKEVDINQENLKELEQDLKKYQELEEGSKIDDTVFEMRDIEDKLGLEKEELNKLSTDLEAYINEIEEKELEIESLESRIGEIEIEIDALIQWAKAEEGIPEIKVVSSVFPKTIILSPNARLEVPETLRLCTIREHSNRAFYDGLEDMENAKDLPEFELKVIQEQKKYSR